MPADDPVLRAARERVAALVELLRTVGHSLGEAEFAERLVGALQDGLADLQALPREDAFWLGWANKHPTVAKLSEHATQRLAHDPGDRTARWTQIALSLARGADNGGLPLIAAEVTTNARAVADAVAIARWIWLEIGIDTCPDLRRALGNADHREMAALAQLPSGDRIGDAARLALRVLAGEGPDILTP